jgi:4-hydroxyacetophenone monooxygenase
MEPRDPRIEEGVRLANIPTLLMLLVQLTGDVRWLEEPYRPKRPHGMSDNDSGGLDQAVQEEIRSAALDAIVDWRAGRPVAWPRPSRETLRSMLSVAMGEPVPEEYEGLLESDVVGESMDVERIDTPPGFNVVIVGAGFAGLCAGYRLQQAGIPFSIIERNNAVGGVWVDNGYPGAGVDTPSHLYSFSFARHDWPAYFALRDDVRAYLERVADELDLRKSIRFGTEVLRATYLEDQQVWELEVSGPGETAEIVTASALISAVGIFNPPVIPRIPGIKNFTGTCVHTAQWPEDLDVRGKRVAVVGNGASAMQAVPAMADSVDSLTIFQRSQQWAVPFERFHEPVPDAVRWLMREVPLYASWYRARLGWTWNDKLHPVLQIDPTWEHPERSVNALNDRQRSSLIEYMRSELGDRQDLLDEVVPGYPPFGRRILLDNGWYRTLTRHNVRLVSDAIAEVRGDAIVTESGETFEVDTIVLATGFDVLHFLTSFEIVGRGGLKLQEEWNDDGRAYLGTTVPGFPNFFCLYGPNLQPGHGGSIVLTLERQVRHVVQALGAMSAQSAGAIEVERVAHDAYNEGIDTLLSTMVWTHPGMTTYYRNAAGRIVVNNPYRNAQFWNLTEQLDFAHYRFEPAVPRLAFTEPASK